MFAEVLGGCFVSFWCCFCCWFVSQCHWTTSLTKEPSRELDAGNKSDQQECANGSPLILKRQTTSDKQAAAGVLSSPTRPEAWSVSPHGRLGGKQSGKC